MWKITRLYLKNNRFIYSGMNKYEINIDFNITNSNSKINLLIGSIGSGKSAILSHLQPFSTVGTLDNRNSIDQTLDEHDGLKIIEYDHDEHHYIIRHEYIWNKNLKSHNTKSYIEKDGKELNSNGNSGSFKELIKSEFGLDQSYLRLLRLGVNVGNLVTLKPVERKKFIASLREDTEIYLMLHKKLSEDYRALNANINAVSNRLMQLSASDEDKMREELSEASHSLSHLMEKIKDHESKIGKLQGVNQTLGDLSSLSESYSMIETTIDSIDIRISNIKSEIEAAKTKETLESISNKIGILQGTINSLEEKLIQYESDMEHNRNEINRFNDIIAMTESNDHMENMQRVLADLEKQYYKYSSQLSNFRCKYTYHFLTTFIDNISVLQNMISELAMVDSNSIKFIYSKLNQSLGPWITTKVNMLTGRRVNIQKAISTIEFSKEYNEPYPLFRAPFCPSENCPYYTSHPATIKRKTGSKKDVTAKISRMQDELLRIDAEISKYQEYQILQKKLQLLKNQWDSTTSILYDLNVMAPKVNLLEVLTNPDMELKWYYHSQLIDILEKTKMQSEFQEVTTRYVSVKNELELLKSPEYESSKYKLEEAMKRRSEIQSSMVSCGDEIQLNKQKLSQLESLYDIIQHKDENQKMLVSLQEQMNQLNTELDKIGKSIKQVQFNKDQIIEIQKKLEVHSFEYQSTQAKVDKLRAIISQIEYNQDEYKSLMEERNTMKVILDALSAKDGIPLILVKVFLDNCKEIINELIADVFDDDLEILDFNISESDFKIPYMVNGQYIDDIEYASQGQSSIISIALSFALVQQSIFDYNIMLLDEVDGPLHFSDREKFIGILFKQMAAIQSNQIFMISHSDGIFEGNPINVFLTSDELIEPNSRQIVTRI